MEVCIALHYHIFSALCLFSVKYMDVEVYICEILSFFRTAQPS